MTIKLDGHTKTADDLQRELSWFEDRYETPSSRLIDAFTRNGRLIETDDFHRWMSLYKRWGRVMKAAARR